MEFIYNCKKKEHDIINRAMTNGNLIKSNELPMLIYGDNFKGLSNLLVSGYRSAIDLIYIDPPFQTNQKFTISQTRANTISRSLKGETAYSDSLNKEQFLEFLRERLVLLHELLSDQGSIYLHTDYKIGHYIKILMDEIFGEENFKNDITRIKSNPKNFHRKAYGNQKDLILFYSKNYKKNIWNDIREIIIEEDLLKKFPKKDNRGFYHTIPIHAPGETKNGQTAKAWRGILPPEGRHWRTNPEEFDILDKQGLIEWSKNKNPRIKKYVQDHKGIKFQDIWTYKDPQYPIYPTEKNSKLLDLIIQQSSNQDSIILDCFAGCGTTIMAAQKYNRKWIAIDNSSAAINVIQKRLNQLTYQYIII
ncbi:MAG: site-specific DNA-methyltransferase [Brevinemataceae bacterium]